MSENQIFEVSRAEDAHIGHTDSFIYKNVYMCGRVAM